MRLSWRTGWYLRLLLVAAIAAGVLIAGAFAWYVASPHTPPSLPLQFNLKAGTTLRGAAQEMRRAGALRHPEVFVLMGRLLRTASRIKAGNYEITEPVTPYRLLQKIVDGDVTQSSIRFVEGWTFRQMREVLNKHPDLAHATRDLADEEILQRLGIQESSPEGWFFPDTYHFASGSSDLRVLRRAHHLMRSHLDIRWPGRAADLPLATPYEALILASIVEKETGKEDDRPLIAAVLLNRLRKGMLLQADPTVIYGLGAGFDGNLRKRDLLADSPYNTYTRAGLPPTPIAMPGLAALTATLNPPASDALYFVSRGDGTSHFSRTLGEHERAVTKYQRSGKR
jgi:UPF0755 protein